MAEKIIGSLIYGEHATPKKTRPLKDRLKVPLAIAAVILVIGGVAYKFANYREERQVSKFMQEVEEGRYESAYGLWDGDERYAIRDFLLDWGKDGFYTKGMHSSSVIDSNTQGVSVVVYMRIDNNTPIAIMVDKETLKLSFSPINKYSQ